MERIKEALRKVTEEQPVQKRSGARMAGGLSPSLSNDDDSGLPWNIKQVQLNPLVLEQNRIVSFDKAGSAHIAFDVLRTKTLQTLQDRGWKTLAVTSPTAGCGKTSVAINLAISMARQDGCRPVLIDLDLRRPSVGKTLGVQAEKPLGYYIEGGGELDKCFVRIDRDLFVGINTYSIRNPAEMMRNKRMQDILPKVMSGLDPTLVIFDLPPMLASDDAMVFLPGVDCGLLVIESGKTTADQIKECAKQFESRSEFLGVVLNKCKEADVEEHWYGYKA